MKKLIILIVMIVVSAYMVSCSSTSVDKVKEHGAKITAKATALGFTKLASCKKPDLIEAHAYSKLMELSWFKPEVQKSFNKGLVSQICVAAIDAILPFMVDFGTGQLPAEWECDGTDLERVTSELAKMACSNIKY